jgi:hypothetical protein
MRRVGVKGRRRKRRIRRSEDERWWWAKSLGLVATLIMTMILWRDCLHDDAFTSVAFGLAYYGRGVIGLGISDGLLCLVLFTSQGKVFS